MIHHVTNHHFLAGAAVAAVLLLFVLPHVQGALASRKG
jgi:hypothetical protein